MGKGICILSTNKQNSFSEGAVLSELPLHAWRDEGWLQYRRLESEKRWRPMNIYQVALNGWKRCEDGGKYDCETLASELACYAKQMGYTHIELLSVPLSHEECMILVDVMHEAGIGVVFSLPRKENGEETATLVMRYVQGYHADGLSLAGDTKLPQDSYDFILENFPEVFVISHISSDFLNCSVDLPYNRLWTDETLAFFCENPVARKYRDRPPMPGADGFTILRSIQASDMAKGSLLDRMPGEYRQKFANVRSFVSLMMTLPGKKRMFMGCEIGEFLPWDESGAVEWFLLDHEAHATLQLFFAEINELYLSCPALWNDQGFRMALDDREKDVISYLRIGEEGETLLVVINVSPKTYDAYEIAVPELGEYEEILNSDHRRFGGEGVVNSKPIHTEFGPQGHFLRIAVPPLAACVFRLTENGRASEDTHHKYHDNKK